MNKLIELLTQTSRDIGEITGDIKSIRKNNLEIKHSLEILTEATNSHKEEIEQLKEEVKRHGVHIDKLQKEIDEIRKSTNKYDKFDAKLTKTKNLISYITFNNVFMQAILSGLVYAILIMLVAMFIDYISIRMGLSEEVIEQIKSGIDRS